MERYGRGWDSRPQRPSIDWREWSDAAGREREWPHQARRGHPTRSHRAGGEAGGGYFRGDFEPLRPQEGLDRARARGGGMGGGEREERVREIMTEDPATVTPDDTIEAAARKMRDLDVGIIPVVEDAKGRKLVGVITDRDMTLRALAEDKGGRTLVKTCMTGRVETIHPDDDVWKVLEVMRTEQVRRVPVVGENDELVGIVAQADLAVDYAGHDRKRRRRVERMLERVSEPARPASGMIRRENESGRSVLGG